MPELFEKWKPFFQPRSRPESVTDEEGLLEERERREQLLGELRDMKTFVNTSTYKRILKKLEDEADSIGPDSVEGLDAAGCYWMQRGVRRASSILSGLADEAEEIQNELE